MKEETVSLNFFQAASRDPALKVLSWQGVNGKGYFAADVKLRLRSGDRVEPDIIISSQDSLWLVEVKGSHVAALADETKLVALVRDLGTAEILDQVGRRSGVSVTGLSLVPAVAYGDDSGPSLATCDPEVVHLSWPRVHTEMLSAGLSGALREIRNGP